MICPKVRIDGICHCRRELELYTEFERFLSHGPILGPPTSLRYPKADQDVGGTLYVLDRLMTFFLFVPWLCLEPASYRLYDVELANTNNDCVSKY